MEDNNLREAWIEPMIEALEIEETNATPGTGGDGDPLPDCSLS